MSMLSSTRPGDLSDFLVEEGDSAEKDTRTFRSRQPGSFCCENRLLEVCLGDVKRSGLDDKK